MVLALVDMFDLTLWLDAARRRRRRGHQQGALSPREALWSSRARGTPAHRRGFCSDRSTCAVVIVADVDDYWLHGITRYYQLMIFALIENSATQELLHRRHPELMVLWHAGLVEIVAYVIVADVDEYWLHDHTRYLQSSGIIRERSATMGLDYFISPRVGFFWFSQIPIG